MRFEIIVPNGGPGRAYQWEPRMREFENVSDALEWHSRLEHDDRYRDFRFYEVIEVPID